MGSAGALERGCLVSGTATEVGNNAPRVPRSSKGEAALPGRRCFLGPHSGPFPLLPLPVQAALPAGRALAAPQVAAQVEPWVGVIIPQLLECSVIRLTV